MADLEQILLHLCRFGRPRLSRMDRGWHCWVSMHVQAVGAAVEIKSEFDHATPLESAQVCLDRVQAVVRDISKLADNKALTHG